MLAHRVTHGDGCRARPRHRQSAAFRIRYPVYRGLIAKLSQPPIDRHQDQPRTAYRQARFPAPGSARRFWTDCATPHCSGDHRGSDGCDETLFGDQRGIFLAQCFVDLLETIEIDHQLSTGLLCVSKYTQVVGERALDLGLVCKARQRINLCATVIRSRLCATMPDIFGATAIAREFAKRIELRLADVWQLFLSKLKAASPT